MYENRIVVTVSDEHYVGTFGDPRSCPLAIALKDVGFKDVYCWGNVVDVLCDDGVVRRYMVMGSAVSNCILCKKSYCDGEDAENYKEWAKNVKVLKDDVILLFESIIPSSWSRQV